MATAYFSIPFQVGTDKQNFDRMTRDLKRTFLWHFCMETWWSLSTLLFVLRHRRTHTEKREHTEWTNMPTARIPIYPVNKPWVRPWWFLYIYHTSLFIFFFFFLNLTKFDYFFRKKKILFIESKTKTSGHCHVITPEQRHCEYSRNARVQYLR